MPFEVARPTGPPPWQFLFRAAAVIAGLTLLLVVDVHGAAFYLAWTLIVLALAGEAVGTLVYRCRSRRAERGRSRRR